MGFNGIKAVQQLKILETKGQILLFIESVWQLLWVMKLPTAELWGISCFRLLRLHWPWLVPTAAELRGITIKIKTPLLFWFKAILGHFPRVFWIAGPPQYGFWTKLFWDSVCCGIFWKIYHENLPLWCGIFVPKPINT